MELKRLKKIYVYDAVLRLLHAVIGSTTVFLMVTGLYGSYQDPGAQQTAIWGLHIASAKVLTTAIIVRIMWALVGTKWALWSELWHWSAWVGYLKDRNYRDHDAKIGHDPYASLAYLFFYFMVMVMAVTGWLLAGMIHGLGPLAEEYFDKIDGLLGLQTIHEVGFWLVGAFVITHLAALAFHEKRRGGPISQAMISGYQYKKVDEEDK